MKKALVTVMVVIFATAVFGQSEIKPLDAPKCLADWLMQNMDGFKIDKLYKIDKKGEISYEPQFAGLVNLNGYLSNRIAVQ